MINGRKRRKRRKRNPLAPFEKWGIRMKFIIIYNL
jgi:hypothetical protein